MAAKKFGPEIRGALLERFAAGLSVADAARAVSLNEKTLKGWLTRGRREDAGDYAVFVRQVDEAREEARSRPTPMDEEEHRQAVSEAARKGSVQALKLYWEMLRSRDPDEPEDKDDPLSSVDDLAEQRASGA